jgi:hypothetical protein
MAHQIIINNNRNPEVKTTEAHLEVHSTIEDWAEAKAA